MRDELRLVIASKVFRGFETLSLNRSLEAAAGTFSLTVNTKEPWPILPGQEVHLHLGSQQVARGFVDRVAPELGENGRRIKVDGRDRTAELVDCSAMTGFGEWHETPLERIVADLCREFSIGLRYEAPALPSFPLFALQPGETAWEAIERACRLRAVLAYPSTTGDLILTRQTTVREAEVLREGENVKSADATIDHSERFYEYVVRGQQFGTDEAYGDLAAGIEGKARDPAIRTQRRLIILAEGAVSDATAQARAEWEATTRAARGTKLSVEVQGWRQRGGKLWAPNQLVPVEIPALMLESDMLVCSVAFGLSDSEGSTTKLELMRPDAFAPQPEVDEESEPFRALVEAGE